MYENGIDSALFRSFLAPGVDRLEFILAWLRSNSVPAQTVELAKRRHIVVRFEALSYDPRFRMKTLIAHYDRADNTPGANDNSAACFMLMHFSRLLASGEFGRRLHNIRIIFTDGEEAAVSGGIAAQGAYALGEGLRKLNMRDDDIYVFDACGRGDTLIVSTSGMEYDADTKLGKKLAALHKRASVIAAEASPHSWIRIPTPFSDNAGLLAAGIASQVITVLPHEEASMVLGASLADVSGKNFRSALELGRRSEQAEKWTDSIPHTWKLMHTIDDNAESLTAEAEPLIWRFLSRLTEKIEPAL
jgi:hypothetical protein